MIKSNWLKISENHVIWKQDFKDSHLYGSKISENHICMERTVKRKVIYSWTIKEKAVSSHFMASRKMTVISNYSHISIFSATFLIEELEGNSINLNLNTIMRAKLILYGLSSKTYKYPMRSSLWIILDLGNQLSANFYGEKGSAVSQGKEEAALRIHQAISLYLCLFVIAYCTLFSN